MELLQAFEERLAEIEAYLRLLEGVEVQARSGPPRLGTDGAVITAQQQRILYSSVYLQLYNLVEATVVLCVDEVTKTALASGRWPPRALISQLRQEWVRVIARTHIQLNYEHRLESALRLCDHLISSLPVEGFGLERGGGGNWDDGTIEEVTDRIGLHLTVRQSVYSAIKRPFRDNLGSLALVRTLRNNLAHGSISFAECGDGVTVSDLRDIADRTAAYLREVVQAFVTFIEGHGFLVPDQRPG